MNVDIADPVLRQLRKLREGVGLTEARLDAAGAVMSALGTSDPHEGFGRLIRLIEGLGESEQALTLKVDFGLDLQRHLGRPPSSREVAWLGDRRSGYGAVVQREVKTLARWSDKAVAELRAALINDKFTGRLTVAAAVRGDGVAGFTLFQQPDGQREVAAGTTLHIDNPSPEPSPPCFVYGYPRDWRPSSLMLSLTFLDERMPASVYAFMAPDFLSATFGKERYLLRLQQGLAICEFKAPRRDLLYGMWWS